MLLLKSPCFGRKLKNFKVEILTDMDRRYIVHTLATMLMSSVPVPTLHDSAVPAKALIKAYPFLADTSPGGREPPHVSFFHSYHNLLFLEIVLLDEIY